MFDLGLDVEMTEYQENVDLLLSMFNADTSFDEVASIDFDGVTSTSNGEVLRELNQAFSTERSENFAAPNYWPKGKRFTTVTAEELQELKEKRQSLPTKKTPPNGESNYVNVCLNSSKIILGKK
jgi:hypothetical protein